MADITVAYEKLDDWECCCGNPEHTRPGPMRWVARADGHMASAQYADDARARLQYMLDCRDQGTHPDPRRLIEIGHG